MNKDIEAKICPNCGLTHFPFVDNCTSCGTKLVSWDEYDKQKEQREEK